MLFSLLGYTNVEFFGKLLVKVMMRMEKLRKVGFVLLTVSIMMIISGTVSSFVVSLKADQEETQKRMVVVKDSFEEFNASVTAFETTRDTLYTEALGNLFLDTLAANDVVLKEKLSNYESIVDDVIKHVKKMDSLCKDVYYPDSDVNSKCSNYKLIYEQVANYFMEDIKLYNTTVQTFNSQQAASGSNIVLLEYKTTKKYVDYNKDKVFEGRTEEKKETEKKDTNNRLNSAEKVVE